jgi:hypothetical protein
MSEEKWYITRTGGHELYVLRLPDDTVESIRAIPGALFSVVFSSKQEAEVALDFIERAIDKSIIAALKEAGMERVSSEGTP